MKQSEIKLIGLQIKSKEKFKIIAKALDVIEKEAGIKQVKISVEDIWLCSDIDFSSIGTTDMEKNLLSACGEL